MKNPVKTVNITLKYHKQKTCFKSTKVIKTFYFHYTHEQKNRKQLLFTVQHIQKYIYISRKK